MRFVNDIETSPWRRVRKLFVATTCAICFAFVFSLRPNLSTSVPGSFFLEVPFSQPRPGDLARVCLGGAPGRYLLDRRPDLSGGWFCAPREARLAKYYLAGAGARVQVSGEGVIVDGREVPSSAPLSVNSLGEPLPVLRATFVLGEGEAWIYGPGEGSYDSRYFGPIPASWLKARLIKVVD